MGEDESAGEDENERPSKKGKSAVKSNVSRATPVTSGKKGAKAAVPVQADSDGEDEEDSDEVDDEFEGELRAVSYVTHCLFTDEEDDSADDLLVNKSKAGAKMVGAKAIKPKPSLETDSEEEDEDDEMEDEDDEEEDDEEEDEEEEDEKPTKSAGKKQDATKKTLMFEDVDDSEEDEEEEPAPPPKLTKSPKAATSDNKTAKTGAVAKALPPTGEVSALEVFVKGVPKKATVDDLKKLALPNVTHIDKGNNKK
jgi:hypothetical protein